VLGLRHGTTGRSRGTRMRFLFRLTFWLALVTLLLPQSRSQTTSNVGVSEAVSAARATVSDMRGFCERQPDACAVGTQTAVALGHRAQAGAKFLYDYLNEHLGPDNAGHSLPATQPRTSGQGAHDNLLPADLAATWIGPQSRREARLDRRPKN
jgi:hypothetical protein